MLMNWWNLIKELQNHKNLRGPIFGIINLIVFCLRMLIPKFNCMINEFILLLFIIRWVCTFVGEVDQQNSATGLILWWIKSIYIPANQLNIPFRNRRDISWEPPWPERGLTRWQCSGSPCSDCTRNTHCRGPSSLPGTSSKSQTYTWCIAVRNTSFKI